MDFQRTALTICGAAVGYIWYKRYRSLTVSDVPGPENPSWIYGHQWLWQCQDGTAVEKSLLEEYGGVARWNATLGEERLWISDPKAVYHILQGTSYLYQKPRIMQEMLEAVFDKGVVSVEGDTHKRQRRAMAPAFGLVESKALYPYFSRCASSLVDKWNDAIWNAESGQDVTVDVQCWLSKATLDAVGAGAFDYDFGAVENTHNKFTQSYTNMIYAAFGSPSKGRLFLMDAFKWTPTGFATWIFERDRRPGMINVRENRRLAHEVAAKLIAEKQQELRDGDCGKDVLSLLVKANAALSPDWRLEDEEVVAQLRTIMFAGHETTARTLTYALWEFAKKPHIQERLRGEIVEMLGRIRSRGDEDFTVDDFDSMPYLLAVGKEILRLYPTGIELIRVPNKDDILPLSKPIVGVSGKVYKELPIPAGTGVMISTIGYNMNKDVWGPDSYEFRPERWFDTNSKPESPVGVYSNLATFSGGSRSCIGWRFAVIEMHTFLVTLLRHFDFSLPDDGRKVREIRSPGNILPVVAGEEHKGPQMWLRVTALQRE